MKLWLKAIGIVLLFLLAVVVIFGGGALFFWWVGPQWLPLLALGLFIFMLVSFVHERLKQDESGDKSNYNDIREI